MTQVKSDISPIFTAGFRPFFLLAAWTAVLLPTFWISIYAGYIDYHGALLSPALWHSHEMIFAFTWSLLAGFLLTASANWTNQTPISGNKLKLLVMLWVIGRLGFLLPGDETKIITIALHCLFPVAFIWILGNYLKGKSPQFKVFVPLLIAFFTANLLMLIGQLQGTEVFAIGQNLGLALMRFVVILMLGRFIPLFSNMKFRHLKIEKNFKLEKAILACTLFLCIPQLDLYFPQLYSTIAFILAILLIYMLFIYKSWKTFEDPLIAILNVGLFWMIVHLLLEGSILYAPHVLYTKAPLHALTAGALGTVALGIMTRVSLAHSGRPLIVDKVMMAAFISMFVGVFFRIYIPVFHPEMFQESLHHASGWWCLAYCFYLYRMTPILMR